MSSKINLQTCEYACKSSIFQDNQLILRKKYELMPLFSGPYLYTEMSDLIQQYLDEEKSWKYTTVLVDPGEKEYFGSTVDGDGNEIKVFLRKKVVTMSIILCANLDWIV